MKKAMGSRMATERPCNWSAFLQTPSSAEASPHDQSQPILHHLARTCARSWTSAGVGELIEILQLVWTESKRTVTRSIMKT
eukprot:SAG31_NODE_359_length_17032_cov_11.017894_15_plen_81_part_00